MNKILGGALVVVLSALVLYIVAGWYQVSPLGAIQQTVNDVREGFFDGQNRDGVELAEGLEQIVQKLAQSDIDTLEESTTPNPNTQQTVQQASGQSTMDSIFTTIEIDISNEYGGSIYGEFTTGSVTKVEIAPHKNTQCDLDTSWYQLQGFASGDVAFTYNFRRDFGNLCENGATYTIRAYEGEETHDIDVVVTGDFWNNPENEIILNKQLSIIQTNQTVRNYGFALEELGSIQGQKFYQDDKGCLYAHVAQNGSGVRAIPYEYNFSSVMGAELEVLNFFPGQNIPTGFCNFVVNEEDLQPETRLQFHRLHYGYDLYIFKNPDDPFIKRTFREYEGVARGEEEAHRKYPSFSYNPVLYWKDPLGRRVRLYSTRSFIHM